MAYKFLILLAVFLVNKPISWGQVMGCTDPQANNFNTLTTKNDGSCSYSPISYTPTTTVLLQDSLEELSGIIYWNGQFWGHNDGGHSPWFFAIDTLSGKINKVIKLTGASNVDWEDITQDDSHIYIGDVGNNANGNRKDLLIYKIPKLLLTPQQDTITLEQVQYEIIRYTYEDQLDFAAAGANNTRFDCEAIFYHGQKLHLVTKNWVGNFAVHYSLPTTAGIQIALRQDSLFTGGFMITGADAGNQDQVLFTSYNRSGTCSYFLVYGFSNSLNLFNTGNKRRIQLPHALQIGQLEAICFINGLRGATGSERFRFQSFSVSQNIQRFSTYPWIIDHYKRNSPIFAQAGMMRYNETIDAFEYFDGLDWIRLGKNN